MGATRPHQLLLESCLKEHVFLLVHSSWLRASVMRDLAQPIAPSALSAFRAVGRCGRSDGRSGAALRAALRAGLRGRLKRIDSDVHRSVEIIAGCDHFE